ncbi:Hypp2150 [Branchiostoma lanceolatum]|uniref:Hypp2150 protein n=1 Tax=Branchiostoma lanceolatum TaxID=7740 RepID=A0A8J9ZP43_BRALA|nr:Hypp2150 [Branchiostoma lanceolatum]
MAAIAYVITWGGVTNSGGTASAGGGGPRKHSGRLRKVQCQEKALEAYQAGPVSDCTLEPPILKLAATEESPESRSA